MPPPVRNKVDLGRKGRNGDNKSRTKRTDADVDAGNRHNKNNHELFAQRRATTISLLPSHFGNGFLPQEHTCRIHLSIESERP